MDPAVGTPDQNNQSSAPAIDWSTYQPLAPRPAAPAPAKAAAPAIDWSTYKPMNAPAAAPVQPAAVAPPQPPPSQPMFPQGTMTAAPKPGFLGRVRDVVANSGVGHSLESTLPGVADALHLHPTESMASPTYQEHMTSAPDVESLLPAWAKKPLTPTKEQQTEQFAKTLGATPAEVQQGKASRVQAQKEFEQKHPALAGVQEGAQETLQSFSTPENLGLLAAAPESKILAGIFSAQAAHGAYASAQEAAHAYKAGNNKEAAKALTEATLSAGMAVAPVLAHGAHEEKPTLHATNAVEALRESAERQAPALGDAAKAATEGVPGAKLEAVRDAKDAARIEDKAERQQVQPSQVSDVAAAKITVPDQAAADKVLENLHAQMPVEKVEGSVTGEPGKNGVRQVQAIVDTRAPQGEPVKRAEVLIQTPEMDEATDSTHDDYRKSQELRAAGKDAEAGALERKIATEHEAAEQAAQNRLNGEPKYKFRSTQTNIPADSEAAQALAGVQAKVDPKDLGGDGLEKNPHVTLRYGLKGDDVEGVRRFLEKQAPFDAKLGKVDAFPPSENSDGFAPLIAHVDAPELHAMEKEIDQHGDFNERSFPDYKPHATIGYVKPEAASKYVGDDTTAGKTFRVNSIAITDRHGNQVEVPLRGSPKLAARAAIGGHDGRQTEVLTPTRKMEGTYRLVEAKDLVPSHNARTFEENASYPKGVQERDYRGSKEAQSRVIQQAQNYDPAYTVNTNPDAVNGPPIITPDGTVLGGNSRAMSTQRLYADGKGDAYREVLKRDAATYGLKPEQVASMKEPVLVRQIERPENVEDARRIGSELNKSMTGALGVSERAVSAGKSLKPETLRTVADMLQQDDSTIRELLSRRGPEILKMMTADGAITERERPQFVDSGTGGLSEEGKTFFERALLGSVIDDPRLMDAAPKSILAKLERSLGSVASFASRPDEWNLLPAVRQAVAEHGVIARSGSTVDLHLNQRSMFGPERNPVVDALVRTLDEKPNTVRAKFEQYAKDADANPHGQAKMFGGGEAYEAFNHNFGSKLTDEEFHNATADILRTDPTAAREQEAGAVRDAGVSERTAAEPAPGRSEGDGVAPPASELAGGPVRADEASEGRRAPRPPAASARERPGVSELDHPSEQRTLAGGPGKAPKPPEKSAFEPGRQSTPVEVRDAEGNWMRGTLDYFNGGVNGNPRRGRVTLENGFKMNNVTEGEMRPVTEANAEKGPVQGLTSGVDGKTKPEHGAIAVDLDKTMATYDGYKGPTEIGKPIPETVDHVKQLLADGKDVWVYTARAAHPEAVPAIKAWTKEHIGQELPVTNVKYPEFERFIDDRAELPVHMQEEKRGTSEDVRPAAGAETDTSGVVEDRGRAAGNATAKDDHIRQSERPELGKGAVPGERAAKPDRISETGTVRHASVRRPGEDAPEGEHPEIARERKENAERAAERASKVDAAAKRELYQNAAEHRSEVIEAGGRKALRLDPDGEALWHRLFRRVATPEGADHPLGADINWRGMTLDRQGVNLALLYLRSAVEDMHVAGLHDEAAEHGFARMTQLLKDSRNEQGGAVILSNDYRADTMREEMTHQWQIEHGLTRSPAIQEVASRPEFQNAVESLREQGYENASPRVLAVEAMAKAMAGDPALRLTDAERESMVRSFLTEAVEEQGSGILENLPPTDPRLKDVINKVRRGYDYGDEYSQTPDGGDEGSRQQAVRGAAGQARNAAGQATGGTRPRQPARERPDAGAERGVREEPPPPTELKAPKPPKKQTGSEEPVFQRPKAPRPVESHTLPGMESDLDAQRASAAEVRGEHEREAVEHSLRSAKGDVSKAAGEMERHSPLFFGSDASEQGTLFQRAEHPDTPEFKRWFGDSKAVDEDGQPRVVYHGTAVDFDTFDPGRSGTRAVSDGGDFGQASYFADRPATAHTYAGSSKLAEDVRYKGPEADRAAVSRVALDRSAPNFLQEKATEVLRWMRDGQTFANAMNIVGSRALAERLGGAMEPVGEPRKPAILPVYLKAEKPLILNTVEDFEHKLYPLGGGKDEWFSLTPAQQAEAVRRAGYDSVHDTKYGQWAVYDPKQVKSALGNSGAYDPDNPSFLFQRAKDEENPVAKSVSALVDDLKAMPKADKGTALDRVAGWTKDTVEESLVRSGKALGGVPSAFEKAFAWAKSVSAALVHDYLHPLEQTDWKRQVGQLQLAQSETAFRLQDLAKELKAQAPKPLDRVAMTHYMEAAGNDAKLKEWAAGNKSRAMQAALASPDRARYLREQQEAYDRAASLTPEQKDLAKRLREHFDDMLELLKKYGLLDFGYRNYVMHLYEKADAANILHLIDTNELNPDPSFLKQRFYDTFYNAEGGGLTPKSKDIGYLLTAYDKSMNEAIASRHFIRSLLDAKAPDGRPIAAIKTRGGWVIAHEGQAPEVLSQRARPKTLEGYRDFDRPQLRNFLFKPTTEDLEGFDPKLFDEDPERLAFRGDLIIHPKYASRVEDMLTPSWFERGESTPQKLGSMLAKGSGLAKELMTAAAPFHMVQEGVHAMEHKVNPFHLPKVDLSDKTQRLLASHGLTLVNYDAEGLFGTKALKGIGEYLPGVNKAMDALHSFSRWQFEDYIPRLKMRMATEAFERNVKRYPELNEEQVAELTARQSNAAFGNLNTTFDTIPRTKTFKTLLRLATFAPDFLEARMRFVGQAFTKYGGEQRAALIRGALAMYAMARVTNALMNNGDAKWDPEHAFSIVRNGKSYSLRTVQGDILHAVTDPRGFIYNRLNPLTTRPIVEYLSGRDQFGRQKTMLSQVKDLGKSALPFALQKGIQTSDESWLNSILTSTGLEARNYRTPTEEAVHKLYLRHIPDLPDDPEKQAETRHLRQLEDKVRSGHMSPSDVWDQVSAGKISAEQASRTIKRAQKSRLQLEFSSLGLRDAIKVFKDATPVEQAELFPEMEKKRTLVAELPADDREKVVDEINELLAANSPH